MSIGQFPLQQAIFSALNVSAVTSDLSCGVFDDVPPSASYPYIVLGEETAVDFSVKDIQGGDFTVNIHVWSQYKGSKETKQIKKER